MHYVYFLLREINPAIVLDAFDDVRAIVMLVMLVTREALTSGNVAVDVYVGRDRIHGRKKAGEGGAWRIFSSSRKASPRN